MTTRESLNDDTPHPGTIKTVPDLLAFQTPDARAKHAPNASRSRADLDAVKSVVSQLSLDGLKELRTWIDLQIGRRDGF